MHSHRLVLASATAATSLVLLLSGCSSAVDAAKDQAGDAVAKAECTAITAAKTKTADLGNVDPATLDTVSSAVAQVKTGLATLGDKVPATVKDQFTAAADQLDQAITDAQADPAKAKDALTAAGEKINTSLDSLATSAGC
jgi:uncharacterized protein YceK